MSVSPYFNLYIIFYTWPLLWNPESLHIWDSKEPVINYIEGEGGYQTVAGGGGGGKRNFTLHKGGGRFCTPLPTLPIINDLSLTTSFVVISCEIPHVYILRKHE